MGPVRELRVAATAEDYEEALRFYRDALGLPVIESWETRAGAVRSSPPAAPPSRSYRGAKPPSAWAGPS